MILGSQIKAARALLGWQVSDLAMAAGVTASTIDLVENQMGIIAEDTEGLRDIIASVERSGVVFLTEYSNGGGPGVRLKPAERVYTDEADTVQYKEYLVNDAPPGAGG
ncbi:transcriptional regulator with XRE-family HTH domain [Rhizobium sp. BK181]|uniref:helix-turn-helix domain-containing protein n=1 Tax=Rhizobium sp. BK181 TaxID=2587072 RepID=UPI00161C2A13|nr:hypothetical protein [Rhizobium sp. BK181]MBB3317597.1 transcriptional regulator with XRE-family HTH domain [Rhizobium sp. BK181]